MAIARAGLYPIITPNLDFLKLAKVVNPKGCSIEQDKSLRECVLVMKGDPSQTRIQLPREDRPSSSLQLRHSLVTLQVNLNVVDHFGMELTLSQSPTVRMKLIIGTFIREATHDQSLNGICTAHLPLIIPRNRWVQVLFHVSGIIDYLFGMPPIKSIDTVALIGTARIGKLMTSSDEQICIDATPEGMALFAVPAYAPPIWSTAMKTENEKNSNADAAAAASPTGDCPTADSDNMKNAPATLPPLSNTSASSPGGSSRAPSRPVKLEPVERNPDFPRASTSEPTSAPCVRSAMSQPPPPSTPPPSRRAPSNKPTYIRLVDNSEYQPIQPRANNSAFPRRVTSSRDPGVYSGEGCEISGWVEDSYDTPPIPKREKEDRKVKKDDGTTEERNQRGLAIKKNKVAQSKAAPQKKEDACMSPAVRRRRRVRRRLQILKANEVKNSKNMVSKSLLASEISITGNAVPPDVSVLTDSDHTHDPKYGYGFGYLGILREDGEYEVDENADLRMKGALSLRLSDDDQDEE